MSSCLAPGEPLAEQQKGGSSRVRWGSCTLTPSFPWHQCGTCVTFSAALTPCSVFLQAKNVAAEIAVQLCESVAKKLEGKVMGTFTSKRPCGILCVWSSGVFPTRDMSSFHPLLPSGNLDGEAGAAGGPGADPAAPAPCGRPPRCHGCPAPSPALRRNLLWRQRCWEVHQPGQGRTGSWITGSG